MYAKVLNFRSEMNALFWKVFYICARSRLFFARGRERGAGERIRVSQDFDYKQTLFRLDKVLARSSRKGCPLIHQATAIFVKGAWGLINPRTKCIRAMDLCITCKDLSLYVLALDYVNVLSIFTSFHNFDSSSPVWVYLRSNLNSYWSTTLDYFG